ncbi:hypothetical protein QN345_08640 [Cryobacterium sp. 10I1]|nr:hypothetical protein [Cryobacterium sp. 10I1]
MSGFQRGTSCTVRGGAFLSRVEDLKYKNASDASTITLIATLKINSGGPVVATTTPLAEFKTNRDPTMYPARGRDVILHQARGGSIGSPNPRKDRTPPKMSRMLSEFATTAYSGFGNLNGWIAISIAASAITPIRMYATFQRVLRRRIMA